MKVLRCHRTRRSDDGADRHHRARRFSRTRGSDDGASLVLVLGFSILVSTIMAALVPFITTSFGGRASLDTLRNRQYAADLVVEESIARVRGLAEPGVTACGPFTRAGVNGVNIRVDCSNQPAVVFTGGALVQQRNVRFTACLDTGVACTDLTAIVRAQVNYDKPTAGAVTRTYIQSWSVNR